MRHQGKYEYQRSWRKEPAGSERVPIPSSCLSSSSRINPRSVSDWEKQFGMQWRNFLTRKQNLSWESDHRVMVWDDSAAMESFHGAESRFWGKNPWSRTPLPSPDMCIDEVDWNSEVDPRLWSEMEAARDQEPLKGVDSFQILLEDIVPTGWDVDVEWQKPSLSGMIVGDKQSSEDGMVEDNGVLKRGNNGNMGVNQNCGVKKISSCGASGRNNDQENEGRRMQIWR